MCIYQLEKCYNKNVKFNQKEHLKKIARTGGLARIKLYGNPGTPSGRILGGQKARITHNSLTSSPFVARKFPPPIFSEDLSEFIGILLGDGGVSARQVTITLHKYDDKDYSDYVARLIKKVFRLHVLPKERIKENVNIIVLSRTLLVEFLKSMGIQSGSKIRNQDRIPYWIESNPDYKRKCLRGLFDTDGCFYVDKHVIKGKVYKNAGMNFTNRSIPLLEFFKSTLIESGFAPTQTSKYCIVLRRESDIVRYFGEIGCSNPKHVNKFRAYIEEKRKSVRVVE